MPGPEPAYRCSECDTPTEDGYFVCGCDAAHAARRFAILWGLRLLILAVLVKVLILFWR